MGRSQLPYEREHDWTALTAVHPALQRAVLAWEVAERMVLGREEEKDLSHRCSLHPSGRAVLLSGGASTRWNCCPQSPSPSLAF